MNNRDNNRRRAWRNTQLFVENAVTNNIVLIQALGLCPIIGAATTLQSGVVLSVCTAAVLLPLSLLMALLGNYLPKWVRPAVYVLLASLLLVGTSSLLSHHISGELYAKLHHFIPLIAVNMLYARTVGFSSIAHPVSTVVDALGSTLGFGIVICGVSALREVLAYGQLWGKPVEISWSLPHADTPFVAFILLGLLAAGLQWSRLRISAFFHRKEDDEE